MTKTVLVLEETRPCRWELQMVSWRGSFSWGTFCRRARERLLALTPEEAFLKVKTFTRETEGNTSITASSINFILQSDVSYIIIKY